MINSKKIILLLLYPLLGFSGNMVSYLEKAFSELQNTDPVIKYSLYNVKSQKYYAKQVIDQYKPSLNIQVYYGYDNYKANNRKKETILKYYSISISQPIFHPEILSQWEKEKSNYKSLKYNYLDIIQKQRLHLISAIINAILTKEKINILEEEKEIYLLLLNEYKELLNSKKILFSEYLSAYRSYKEILKKIKEVKTELNIYIANIQSLIGRDINLNFQLNFDFDIETLRSFLGPFLKKERILRNYSLKSLELKIKAAKYEFKTRKYYHWPKLDLLASYTYSTSTTVSIAATDKRIMLALTIPIYAGGRYGDAVKEAEYLLQASRENFNSTKRNLVKSFILYKTNLKKDLNYLSYDRDIIKKFLHEIDLYRSLVEKGFRPNYEFLEKRINLLEAKINFVNDIQNLLNDFLNLLYIQSAIESRNLEMLDLIFINTYK